MDGVKEFHLVAEPVKTEFVPGRHVDVWGFNGHMPGPTIEINEGDRVRVIGVWDGPEEARRIGEELESHMRTGGSLDDAVRTFDTLLE